MKLSFILTFGLLLVPRSTARSQTLDSALALFPLDVGNVWQYSDDFAGQFQGYYTLSILGDTILPNGKAYRILSNPLPYSFSAGSRFLRMDSATANIYVFDSTKSSAGKESLWDSLRAGQGNRTPQGLVGFGTTIVLGMTIMDRWCGFPGSSSYSLVYGIGPSGFIWIDYSQFEYRSTVIYANINGREYGARVSVNEFAHMVPKSFDLSQNYPNPFNPSTTIRYSLPQQTHVTLTVFNTLGQQVSTQVNENEDVGYHDVRFDASGLASGVYFYRLQAGSFVKTMKCVIVR